MLAWRRITSAMIALIGSATEALETFDAIVFDGMRVVDGEVAGPT